MPGLRSRSALRGASMSTSLAATLVMLTLVALGCSGSNREGAPATAGAGGAAGETSGSSGFGGASGVRPPQPQWMPPFALGSQGWRDGTTPNCVMQRGKLDAFGVWADSRGVFTLASFVCDPDAGVPCGAEGLSLKYNRGSGWQVYYETQPGAAPSHDLALSGFRNGSVLLRGVLMGEYGVFSWSNGVLGEPLALTAASQWFVADYENAYVADGAMLYGWHGPTIEPSGMLPTEATALWANDEIIAEVANEQLWLRPLAGREFAAVGELPPGEYTAIWGFGSKDLWLGNAAGELVHYDGTKFDVVETAALTGNDPRISELWGADGELYFHTSFAFGRVPKDSNQAELLIGPTDPDDKRIRFTGLWGISPSEVFVTLFDADYVKYECNGLFTLVYDGTEFHDF